MKLNILGSTYQVDFVDSISRDELRVGETDYLNQTIKILSGLHSDQETVTLIHEILHIIFSQLEFIKENNEHLIQGLATSLYQVFKENEIFYMKNYEIKRLEERKERRVATLNNAGDQLFNRDDLEPLFNKLDRLFKDNLQHYNITPALMNYLLAEYEEHIENKILTL